MIFGDPTRIGFFTTGAYLAAAGMCCVSRSKTRIPGFFGAVAVLMLALGIRGAQATDPTPDSTPGSTPVSMPDSMPDSIKGKPT